MALYVVNATPFFKRQVYLYSFGDIKLKTPIPLTKAAHIMTFVLCWTIPLFFIFGLHMNVFYLAFLVVPPFVLGNLATKPIFGGKGLFDFANTIIEFMSEPKGWTDGRNNSMSEETYQIVNEIWIGRRRELQLLADLVEDKAYIVHDEDEEEYNQELQPA